MEIKVLGVCGSPIGGGNTEVFLKESLKAAETAGDVKTELVTLAERDIRDCRHCNWCLSKEVEGKFCVQQDGMADIYSRVLEADALLLASPVYIGRLSGRMACFIDRLRPFVLGNIYRGRLKNRIGGGLAVAWGRNGGIETTLLSLLAAFLVMEMIPVGPSHSAGSPYGASGLNGQLMGKLEAGDRLGVLQDDLGLRGARSLGKRVVEITRMLKQGTGCAEPVVGPG